MVTITTLTEKAIAVTGLPEGAKCTIANNVINDSCITLIVKDKHGNNTWHKLPEGNWTILGRAAELTESQKAVYEPLLKAKGLHVSNPFGSHPSTWEYIDIVAHKLPDDTKTWDNFQLISNPLILIK